jgi:2-keto-4-pentenoate hydratase/2-oxohepta-3-ene-1,7-dioic acid hydratase in catechol pathway
MRLCRYDVDRLGVVVHDQVLDVTSVLSHLERATWLDSRGDPLIAGLGTLRPAIEALLPYAPSTPVGDVELYCPVVRPGKVIGAPVNYRKHLDESRAEEAIHFGRDIESIDYCGLFLKASSSVVGPAEGVALRFAERRNDHEIELVVVIGTAADRVSRDEALDYVAGYCVGLDMTVRGTEERSLRKSIDSYTVVGPWLVTADEIANPDNLDLELLVGGELRQRSNTRHLIFEVARLIMRRASTLCIRET